MLHTPLERRQRFLAGPLLLIRILASVTVIPVAFAQTTLTTGVVVTGACNGHEHAPGCLLPSLFGPTGLNVYLNQQSPLPHYAHFIGPAQTTLNQTLSSAIATQLAILPIVSPASGFTYKFDGGTGVFVRSTSSFGPIYTERADTIGRRNLSLGVSYQRFRFSGLDTLDLGNVPAVFSHVAEDPTATYEADVISTSNRIDLKMDQTVVYGTLGITDRFDLSIAVPFLSVRMDATSNASIVRVSGALSSAGGRRFPNPHEFDASGGLTKTFSNTGSAAGIGDVTFRAKAKIFQTARARVAALVDVRAPTGDATQLLGSGAPSIKPFLAISGGQRFSPHMNIGYQWNGKSILAGDVSGTTFGEGAGGNVTIRNGPVVKRGLPGALFYSAGTDVGVTGRLTLAVDYLGQVLIDAPRVFRSDFLTTSVPGGIPTEALGNVTAGRDTIGLNNGAVGVKYNLLGKLLLTADVLFRLDNKGLRQDVTPLVSLSYSFGQ